MKTSFKLKVLLVAVAMLTFSAAQAANISKVEYNANKTRISADYKADKAACAALTANAKDICVQEAKAKEKVARAELVYSDSGKASDRTKVLEAKAKSAYAVAKEKCDDNAGNAKDVCVKEAKAVETAALADAKMGKKIGEAKKEATNDKLDANYKVAVEKCDALAGEPKTSCIAAAKAKFSKS